MTASGFADSSLIRLISDVRINSELHTQVVLPAGAGPHPVLLVRTPYSTSSHLTEAFSWAAKGIGSVLQDVRGRYESGGCWEPFTHESTDGFETLLWIRQQSWSDGRVIAYGSSYGAHCALEVARQGGDLLTGVAVTVPALSLAHTIREPSGVPRLFAHAWWWGSQGDQSTTRGPVVDGLLKHQPQLLTHLPVSELPDRLGLRLPGWTGAWDRQRDDWSIPGTTTTGQQPRVGLPPLVVLGGLYDVYCDDAVALWRQWPGESARLLINTWQHDLGLAHRDRNAARLRQPAHRIPAVAVLLGWVTQVLKGSPTAGRRGFAAVESSGQWCFLPATSEPTGTLELLMQRSKFLADPDHPFPSAMGPVDIAESLMRSDCALLTTETFIEDVDLVGTLTVELDQVEVSVPDGLCLDWAVRVVECRTSGQAVQLGHGIVRTADRVGLQIPISMLSHRLTYGSYLAVQVSAHQFPLFPRDPQTGEDPLTTTDLRPLTRSVRNSARIRYSTSIHPALDLSTDDLLEELLQ